MKKLGVVMDPIESISFPKDSTLAMMVEAQQRGWMLSVIEPDAMTAKHGNVFAEVKNVTVSMDSTHWYDVTSTETVDCATFDMMLMRQDPPLDMQYINNTYLLELIEAQGVFVANKPQSLRDFNEKMATLWFPECCPSYCVSRSHRELREFIREHQDCVVKPLDGMGGMSVFRVQDGDRNLNVILETLHQGQTKLTMAQQYIPAIKDGDKRILMIAGEPVEQALARIPAPDDNRGNLASGATAKGVTLTDRDRWICEQVGPTLKEKGLWFVGIDVIGDYLLKLMSLAQLVFVRLMRCLV